MFVASYKYALPSEYLEEKRRLCPQHVNCQDHVNVVEVEEFHDSVDFSNSNTILESV